jgi:hypothetical protein
VLAGNLLLVQLGVLLVSLAGGYLWS